MKTQKTILPLLIMVLGFPALFAQQINLDKVVRAGELTLFQELRNPKAWYYIIDKPSIAKDKNGVPEFSFLRYVQNVRSTADANENREAEGGGIVHALIELGVTNKQVKDAQKALQSIVSGGIIQGPVIYKEGAIALVSSFVKADGKLSNQVLGIGKAPMLDGQRAAFSIQLTKKGAKILWESFKTPNPDMSVSFEMTLIGYRSPKRAIIEADFEQIYKHKDFQIGVASTVLAAEIKAAFDDMVKKGAIKVTQIGSDEDMDKIIETAYNKILGMMFQPSEGTGTPSLGSLAGLGGSKPSILDRATNLLNKAKTDARAKNKNSANKNNGVTKPKKKNPPKTPTTNQVGETEEVDETTETVEEEGGTKEVDEATETEEEGKNEEVDETTETEEEETEEVDETTETIEEGGNEEVVEEANDTPKDKAKVEKKISTDQQQEQTIPSFAVALSFEMKRVRQRGVFKIDLNKYTTDNITLRFDKNFGNIKCEQCFRQVNLDDALFKQRELVAFIDGANATDFGSYINFVTLSMKKTHQNGNITIDEVRIDRNNFNKEGNNFKLLYGWKGDDNRTKWLNYKYKTTWSFFGGYTMETEWINNSAGAITLAPLLLQKTITIEADPDTVLESEIRAIDVKFYYNIGDKEQTKSITLTKKELSKTIDIILPKNIDEFEYEINWTIRGNKRISSGKLKTNSSVIFVDELPKK